MLNKVSLETIKKLPKIELHAHLSASLTRESFLKMLRLKHMDNDISFINSDSLEDVFAGIFLKIRESVTHRQDHEYVCREVFQDFQEENVKYLEIRSTPKALQDIDSISYIDTVLDVIQEFEDSITIRYLISLNRLDEPSSFDPIFEELRHNERW